MEKYGWKLVHADVFRPPSYPMLISVMCGSGMQILTMSIFTIIFACMGFLHPSNRGYLLITLLLLYVIMRFVAGYTTSRMYKTFKGKIQRFGDNSEIENVGRISKKCFAIFDVSQFSTLVAFYVVQIISNLL